MLRRGSVLMCLMILAVVFSGCQAEEVQPQDNLNYIAVETQSVTRGVIQDRTILSGRAMPQKDVMVLPQMPGTVDRLYVVQGQWVDRGDRLFAMDPSSIASQLSQAEAAYNSANVNYQMTEDQILTAKVTLERMQKLYAEGAISQSQFEQAELAASEKPLEAAAAGLQQASAGYASARDAYNDTVVTAPISGIVTSLSIEVGEMASNAQPAMIIVDIEKLIVKLNVTEKLVNEINVGDAVDVEISAVDVKMVGTVISVSPMIDSRTMLYPVDVAIDNPDGLIKASMYTEVSLITEQSADVLFVPSDAVIVKDNQTVVYTVVDDIAQVNSVEIGLDNGSKTEIISGLNEGDEIITSGQHYVSGGSVVKVIRGE